jgi:hypothetical protein
LLLPPCGGPSSFDEYGWAELGAQLEYGWDRGWRCDL